VSQIAPSAIVALITHARDVPAIERARFATQLRDELTGATLILETCHRVEGYVVGADDAERLALVVALPAGGRALIGEDAIRHAIAVAVGRDSVVVGEDQVLHQLRASVDAARTAGGLDPALERLFALALQAGRRARSWRQGPLRSLADVAISSIERQAGPLPGRDILVVGAGPMGHLAARAAAAAGSSVSVANRSAEGAEAVAATTGARIEAFDPGRRAGVFAGVIVALGGPWPIGAETVDSLVASGTVVVDLSVPVAVPEMAAAALGLRFVSGDSLALADADAEPGTLLGGSLARLDALADRTTDEYLRWLRGRDGRAAAEALVERADREREVELAALWRRLPDLEPEARVAIERMTRHLARRLLRQPLERLGRDSDGRDERAVRDIFAL
jgi:glutamyl-tRNA reductase